jgi:hypothetical protein
MIVNKNNFSKDIINYFQEIDGKFKGPSIERKWHLNQVLTSNMIEGQILEFGVYQGKTINLISKIFENEIVWGFDSFEGLPEDWFTDSKEYSKHPKGHFKVDKMPDVNKNVKLVKGFYKDSLRPWIEENTKNIKFLHVDCDLYSSTIEILSLLNSQIVPGTIIVFDEFYPWGEYNLYNEWEAGEFKALYEWITLYDREFTTLLRSRHQQCSIRIVR